MVVLSRNLRPADSLKICVGLRGAPERDILSRRGFSIALHGRTGELSGSVLAADSPSLGEGFLIGNVTQL